MKQVNMMSQNSKNMSYSHTITDDIHLSHHQTRATCTPSIKPHSLGQCFQRTARGANLLPLLICNYPSFRCHALHPILHFYLPSYTYRQHLCYGSYLCISFLFITLKHASFLSIHCPSFTFQLFFQLHRARPIPS